MKFEVTTVIDRKALTAAAKAVRKTLRRKKNLLVRGFGIAVIALELLNFIWFRGWISLALAAALMALLLGEDAVNGAFAVRQLVPGTSEVQAIFDESGYKNITGAAESLWKYGRIEVICETKEYFIFLLGPKHGQIYDKTGFTAGSAEDFRAFISERTGKPVQYIK